MPGKTRTPGHPHARLELGPSAADPAASLRCAARRPAARPAASPPGQERAPARALAARRGHNCSRSTWHPYTAERSPARGGTKAADVRGALHQIRRYRHGPRSFPGPVLEVTLVHASRQSRSIPSRRAYTKKDVEALPVTYHNFHGQMELNAPADRHAVTNKRNKRNKSLRREPLVSITTSAILNQT